MAIGYGWGLATLVCFGGRHALTAKSSVFSPQDVLANLTPLPSLADSPGPIGRVPRRLFPTTHPLLASSLSASATRITASQSVETTPGPTTPREQQRGQPMAESTGQPRPTLHTASGRRWLGMSQPKPGSPREPTAPKIGRAHV